MSTAGKVLVVLVLLIVPVWILLASAVAQLNAEWGQELEKQRTEVARLEQAVTKNQRDIQALTDQISLEQDTLAEHRTLLTAQLADVERTKAETVAIQAAIKVQLDVLNSAIKNAEVARQQRSAEKQSETEGKAKAEKEVADLKGQNAELMDHLTQLRNDFKSILESNKTLVDRLKKQPSQGTRRPAVFVR